MDDSLKELVEKINQLRTLLHEGFLETGSSEELLTLSQKLDQLILEYIQLQKKYKSF